MAKSLTNKYKRKGAFIMKHEEWLNSPAYRDLTPVARCLLDEFQRVYRPGRNGALSISIKNAKKLLNVHKDTAGKAFYELAEHGFIKLKKGAYYIQRQAREWALTFEPCNGKEPTDDWKSWKPGNPVVRLSMKPRYKKMKSGNMGQTCPKKSNSLVTDLGQMPNFDVLSYPILTMIQ